MKWNFGSVWGALCAVLLACAFQLASAQPLPKQVRFTHLTVEQGLSQNSVFCFYQTRDGYIWIGTADGLNRFDGYGFEVLNHNPSDANSLADGFISDMVEDSAGYLWIGTRKGLTRYNPATGIYTRYQNKLGKKQLLNDNQVRTLLLGQVGYIWIGTSRGLDRLNPATGEFKSFKELSGNNLLEGAEINAIHQDASGKLWLGLNERGLACYDPSTRNLRFINLLPARSSNPEDEVDVIDIAADQHGSLWLATRNNGLFYHDPAAGRTTSYVYKPSADPAKGPSSNNLASVCVDRYGRVWIANISSGVDLFEPGKGTFRNFAPDRYDIYSPNSRLANCIYEDRNGILWFGTFNGVNKVDPLSKAFYHVYKNPADPYSLASNVIRCLLQDSKGNVWVGSQRGLSKAKPGSLKFETLVPEDEVRNSRSGLTTNFINAILEGKDGTIWVGTLGGGLHRYNPGTNAFTKVRSDPGDTTTIASPDVSCLAEDTEGRIWVGTINQGISIYDPRTGKARRLPYGQGKQSLSDAHVRTLYRDKAGNMWVGTWTAGLCQYSATGRNLRCITYDDNYRQTARHLSHGSAISICEGRDGYLWVGTYGGGLNRIQTVTGEVKVFDQTSGLPNNVIYGIQQDRNGALWLSSNKGMARFQPKTGKVDVFGADDGIQNPEFNSNVSFQAPDGKLYFGGINGFNVFYPDSIQLDTLVPPVVISGIEVFQKRRPGAQYQKLLELGHNENFLTIAFAALNYNSSNGNQYAYKLEGVDRDWVYCGNKRSITYTNLPSGSYTFMVKGSNHDGTWNETPTLLRLYIRPPFYATWWFILAATSLVAVGVYLGYQARLSTMRERSLQLEEMIKARTSELDTRNQELSNTIDALHQAEIEAEQNQEMANLGKIVPNLAHELNSPIGAIRASSSNIESLLETFHDEYPDFLQSLNEREVAFFRILQLQGGTIDVANMTTRQQRTIRQRLEQDLEFAGIENSGQRAAILLQCGITTSDDVLEYLFLPRADEILDKALNLNKVRGNLRNIHTATDKTRKLIDKLRHFIKTRKETYWETVNLVDTLQTALRTYASNMQGITVETFLDVNPTLLGGTDELTLVWAELIHNAIQSMQGQGRLVIQLETEADVAVVSIIDDGPGIPEVDQPRLFEPFYSMRKQGEGMGLGLFVSRRIIEAHEGTIEMYSVPGRTEFKVRLPLRG